MKNKLLILLCLFATISFAQNKNPLQEAMDLVNESKTLYSLKIVDKIFPAPDRSRLINIQVYREKKDDGYDVKAIKATGEAKKLFDKAESLFWFASVC